MFVKTFIKRENILIKSVIMRMAFLSQFSHSLFEIEQCKIVENLLMTAENFIIRISVIVSKVY